MSPKKYNDIVQFNADLLTKRTAYHEAGHALFAYDFIPSTDVLRSTIRGNRYRQGVTTVFSAPATNPTSILQEVIVDLSGHISESIMCLDANFFHNLTCDEDIRKAIERTLPLLHNEDYIDLEKFEQIVVFVFKKITNHVIKRCNFYLSLVLELLKSKGVGEKKIKGILGDRNETLAQGYLKMPIRFKKILHEFEKSSLETEKLEFSKELASSKDETKLTKSDLLDEKSVRQEREKYKTLSGIRKANTKRSSSV